MQTLMKLDFGTGRLPGLLALGAEDPHQFRPTHGTDLLAFFAAVFERKVMPKKVYADEKPADDADAEPAE